MKKHIYLLIFLVLLGACSFSNKETEEGLVENYIREHITELSPVEAVLGGTWYVVDVEFLGEQKVHVIYEDGHIQEEFDASYVVSEGGTIILNF